MAGLTVKRDDVTGLAPTGDLDLTEKSSLRLDSLLLMFGPAEHFKQNRILPLRATSALKKQKTFDLILVPNDTPIFFFFLQVGVTTMICPKLAKCYYIHNVI